ncbi:hypothetical protein NPIL_696991 [Nephila pilipes]|uniref:Uncharacterized protein n=1 Tax=Nephila pilipes TaxID=299642 RepID=A0A8X6TL91_NEPPI|nr:hypothetical protein NPIL_696991 [Nephila pilipes]
MRKSIPSKENVSCQTTTSRQKTHFQRGDKIKEEEPSEVVCYGCGTPGVIKPKCPSCKGKDQKNHGTFRSVILQSVSCPSK